MQDDEDLYPRPNLYDVEDESDDDEAQYEQADKEDIDPHEESLKKSVMLQLYY